MATMILQTSKLCKNHESETIALLIQYCEVLFGLKVQNLPTNLWVASFEAICERFSGIMIHDIQNAFRYAQIEKRQFVSLTRDELIEPVSQYWTKRQILLNEIKVIEAKSAKELESINKDKEFRENSKQKYKDCLESGVWTGDEFEADAIARNFKDCFDQTFKDEIMKRAKNENFNRQRAAEGNSFILIPSWRKIFSRIYIEECLKRRILFIED